MREKNGPGLELPFKLSILRTRARKIVGIQRAAILAKVLNDLICFGKAVLLVFGEDEPAVGDYVELADFSRAECGVESEFFFDCGRETRGSGFVVSDVAVENFDMRGHALTMGKKVVRGKRSLGPVHRDETFNFAFQDAYIAGFWNVARGAAIF